MKATTSSSLRQRKAPGYRPDALPYQEGPTQVYNDSTGRATSPSFTVPDHTQMEVEGEHADFTDHLAAGKGVDDLVLVSPVEVAALAAIRDADTDQRGTYTEDEFWLSRPELRHIQLFLSLIHI